MGFATGFRSGLAAGGERRSNMPIVQGLGSMIDRIEKRQPKKGSMRFGGSIGGASAYDKYKANQKEEAAIEENKRRFDVEQERLKERDQQATDLAEGQAEKAAVVEERTAETHASRMATETQNREKAAAMFKRSEKKEDRVEAYRGFIQGIQSRNKALTEASWAALAPDMEDKEVEEWAPIKDEVIEITDPETGEVTKHKKYTVGRDAQGQESKNAMPAPAITYNDDGSIAVEYPGQKNPVVYQDAKEFAHKIGYPLNPEYEADQKTTKKDKKKEAKESIKNQLKFVDDDIKALDKRRANDQVRGDEYDEKRPKLIEKRDKLRAKMTGQKSKVETVKITTPEGEEMLAYSGKQKPTGTYPGEVKQDEKGAWHWTDPKTNEKNYFYPPED